MRRRVESTRVSAVPCLMTAALIGVVFAGQACTDRAVNDTRSDAGTALGATTAGADKALDATKKAGDETADAAKGVARKAADKTTAIAGDVAEKSQEVASAAGVAVTEGWITTKVKAKFADEQILDGSDIHVVTNGRLVTLTGTVASAAAKTRADAIARGTEQVSNVVNRLVVKEG